jgi:hypothetical protein
MLRSVPNSRRNPGPFGPAVSRDTENSVGDISPVAIRRASANAARYVASLTRITLTDQLVASQSGATISPLARGGGSIETIAMKACLASTPWGEHAVRADMVIIWALIGVGIVAVVVSAGSVFNESLYAYGLCSTPLHKGWECTRLCRDEPLMPRFAVVRPATRRVSTGRTPESPPGLFCCTRCDVSLRGPRMCGRIFGSMPSTKGTRCLNR